MHSASTRITLLFAALAILVAGFGTQVIKLDRKLDRARQADLRLAETTYLPPNAALRTFSLGFEPLVSDLVFMQANSYFATHLSVDRKYRWLDDYMAAIVGFCRDPLGRNLFLPPRKCAENPDLTWEPGLFPFNPRVYSWASQVVKFAPLLTNEVIDKSTYYGTTGIYFCPDSWELYFDVGFNLFFEYRDLPHDVREARKKEAVEHYFSVAASLPNSNVDPNFVAGALWQKSEGEAALKQIYITYYHASDEQRHEIRTNARFYGHADIADLLEQDEKNRLESFPFVPQSLYHLLGPMGRPGATF